MADMKLAELALDQVKYHFMKSPNSVFLTTLLFSQKILWNSSVPTAYTNGLEIGINPDYFLSLDFEYRVSLLAHEVWHTAFDHLLRLENRNPACFNRAADHAMNLYLESQGYKIHSTWLCDPQYKNMTAEQIYDILIQDPANSDPYGHSDLNYTDPATNQAQSQQISSNIVKAHTAASMAGQGGSVPSFVTNTIKEIMTPPINWRAIFQRFVQMVCKIDYSFKKVNRRYFPEVILPTIQGEKIDQLVVACDSSGSVSDEDLSAFLNQTNIARATLKPEKTTMLMFDTSVRDVVVFNKNQPAKYVDFSGRGGTDPTCVFEYLEENKIKPIMLIIFSDMDFHPLDESMKPSYPVLWVSYKAYRKSTVNFGKLIEMPVGKE